MEATASRSFLLSLPYPFLGTNDPKITRNATPTLLSPAASLRGFNFGSKDLKPQRYLPSSCSSSKIQGSKPSHNFALLLEVEGILADIYHLGNRQAFNVAFQKLGLDCANWTEPIYSDLARKAGGHEERMMILFFNRIGWPTSLPTNEKETFMKSILREKRKALEEFVESSSLPLQSGVENFIDEALSEGIPIVMLTAYSQNGEKLARSVIEKLGRDRLSNIKIVGKDEVERSFYGQLVLGKGVSSSLDEQLAKEVQKAVAMEKRRIAEQVASVLKLSVDIDANPSESLEKVVATLRAGAEHGGFPVKDCVLITGSQSGVRGAESIGMPFVVLRNSKTKSLNKPALTIAFHQEHCRIKLRPTIVEHYRKKKLVKILKKCRTLLLLLPLLLLL